MSEWIRVDESKPEFWQCVLVCRTKGNKSVSPARFDGKNFIVTDMAVMQVFQESTHWMPLPEPPNAS